MRLTLVILIVAALLGGLLSLTSAAGGDDEVLAFQGRITDEDGFPLTGTYSVTFRVYAAATGGSPVWSETHGNVVLKNGIFSVLLGETTPLTLGAAPSYWVSIEVGTDGEMSPRLRLARGHLVGSKGEKGEIGTTGAKGDKGDPGIAGVQGDKGDPGATGLTGPAGAKGDKGETGAKGDAGTPGAKGDTGATGSKGDKGDTGLIPFGGSVSGSSGSYAARFQHTGTGGDGVRGESTSAHGISGTTSAGTTSFGGIYGYSGAASGVFGQSIAGYGVRGLSTSNAGVSGTSTTGYGVYGQSPSGVGVRAISTSATGMWASSTSNYGAYGFSTSSYGVFGESTKNAGVYGRSTSLYGVYGTSTGSYGVYGESKSSYGVYATSTSSYGVYAVSTSSYGVYAVSNKSHGAYGKSISNYGLVAASNSNHGLYAWTSSPSKYAGYFVGQSSSGPGIWVSGKIIKTGTVSFVERHPTDRKKAIVYICLEGGEAGTYCRGTARLTDGLATIDLPEDFQMVTAATGLTVQVTPTQPCKGLLVTRTSRTQIEVRELNQGTSDAEFYWTVNGIRRGYENYEPITSEPAVIDALNLKPLADEAPEDRRGTRRER